MILSNINHQTSAHNIKGTCMSTSTPHISTQRQRHVRAYQRQHHIISSAHSISYVCMSTWSVKTFEIVQKSPLENSLPKIREVYAKSSKKCVNITSTSTSTLWLINLKGTHGYLGLDSVFASSAFDVRGDSEVATSSALTYNINTDEQPMI